MGQPSQARHDAREEKRRSAFWLSRGIQVELPEPNWLLYREAKKNGADPRRTSGQGERLRILENETTTRFSPARRRRTPSLHHSAGVARRGALVPLLIAR